MQEGEDSQLLGLCAAVHCRHSQHQADLATPLAVDELQLDVFHLVQSDSPDALIEIRHEGEYCVRGRKMMNSEWDPTIFASD